MICPREHTNESFHIPKSDRGAPQLPEHGSRTMNAEKTSPAVNGQPCPTTVRAALSLILAAACIACFPLFAGASPLEPDGYLAVSGEEFVSIMDGRFGLERDPGGAGTLNDLSADLGLPKQNQTLWLEMLYRPLEHHVLRLYGSVPESYSGDTVLGRNLTFKTQTIPAGTKVDSTMHVGQFGLGYDLDFILGRRIQAGANGDLRFLDYYVRLKTAESGMEHTFTVDEVVPCIGGHGQALFKPELIPWPPGLTVGGYARLTYGINPNYLNLFEIKVGLTGTAIMAFGTTINVKVGYQVQGWNQVNVAGRDCEFRRDGLFVGLAGSF